MQRSSQPSDSRNSPDKLARSPLENTLISLNANKGTSSRQEDHSMQTSNKIQIIIQEDAKRDGVVFRNADQQSKEDGDQRDPEAEKELLLQPLSSKDKKKVDFAATGNSSQLGMSMISALSEETPSPAGNRSAKKAGLSKQNEARRYSPCNKIDDEFERDNDDDNDNDNFLPLQEVQLPSKIYNDLISLFPPNPLLPKSFHAKDDSPRSGGVYKFMKLTKFRGMDHGRSKFREEACKIERIGFPDGITMKKIFKIINAPDCNEQGAQTAQAQDLGPDGLPKPDWKIKHEPQLTPYGEVVYMRNNSKDFITKQRMFGNTQQKDEVLDENLLDVKNLLNNATSSQAAHGKQPGQKALVNLSGIESYYLKKDKFDKTLIFESRFESGNLAAALKVNEADYYLALQNDVNTSGNTQWFFFRVSNTKSYSTVRFNILNLCKPDSLFNEGMKVLVYSEKNAQEKDIGWHRSCSKIAYYPNGIRKEGTKYFRTLYTMTFTYEFEYEDDNVYFAYCYPYTYTELIEELNAIMADPIKQQYVQRKTLTETLAGNKCEMLTITSKQNQENMHKRKGVILTARVHPGESVGSWMMKGALDFLVDPNCAEAEYLRQNFVFKIVPMLNPDGVINGNYRCSLAGCDLNRRWKRPSKVLHPTIFATKTLCHQFSKERDLQIFCDFHGHSRRKNIFMYGCNVPNQPEDTRLFPFIMSQICPFFVYNYSRFGNQKSKESTARMALFNELKCPAIYTIESSFCGNDMGPYRNYHFSTNNLMQTGRDFCRTLILYLPIQVPKSILSNFQQNISDLYNHYKIISDSKIKPDIEVENMIYYFERLEKVRSNNKEIQSKHVRKGLASVLRQTADIFTDGHNSSSSAGSDNAPSEDNLEIEEIEKVLPVQEDPDLAIKFKKSKTLKQIEEKKEESVNNALKTENSLNTHFKKGKGFNDKMTFKRKGTSEHSRASLKSQKSDKNAPGYKKLNLNLHDTQIDEEENDADDEGDKVQKDKNSQREEEKDQVAELRDEGTGNVTHKKRRRRNVESRDVSTQTERSDYFLIKQRQQEKQQERQKQFLAIITKKNEKHPNGDDHPTPEANTPAQILQAAGISTNSNQQSISQSNNDPKSLLQIAYGGSAYQDKPEHVSQKFIEDYLIQQKQGLVNNILNQYNIQQKEKLNSSSPTKIPDGVNLANNFMLQNSQNNDLQDELSANSPNAPPQANSSLNSPSKKHRNLIQTRQGAAQIANQMSQQQHGSSTVNNSQQFNQNKQLTIGQAAGQPHFSQNFFGQQHQQRMGLSTANSGQRTSSMSRQIPRQGQMYPQEGDMNPQAVQKGGTTQGQTHSKSNVNIQYQSGLKYAQDGAKNQNNAAQNQTHWQKVSSNNHELTKLFYQLPGGTKNLVSNAIQSQNKPQQPHQSYTSTKKGSRHISLGLEKKMMATPDPTAKKQGHFNLVPNTELPGIPNANTQLQVSKTPGQNKQYKRQSQNALNHSNHTAPLKPKQQRATEEQYQISYEAYQATLQQQLQAASNQMIPNADGTSINSFAHNSKKGGAPARGSGTYAGTSSQQYEMDQQAIQMQKFALTSKKPPMKQKPPDKGQQQSRLMQGREIPDNLAIEAYLKNQPQSATLQKESLGTNQNGTQNTAVISNMGQGQKNYTSDQQILDNYDFQLGLNKERNKAQGPQPSSIHHMGGGLIQQSAVSFTASKAEQSDTNAFGQSQRHLKHNQLNIPQQHQRTFQDDVRQTPINPKPFGQPSSQPTSQLNDIGGEGKFSNIYVGKALAAGNQNHQNYQQNIMENQFIQEKLNNINGDLKEFELIGDQITAEIVKKLNPSDNEQISFNQNIQELGGGSQINVYNNYQQSPQGISNPGQVSSSMQVQTTGMANQMQTAKIARVKTANKHKDMQKISTNEIPNNGNVGLGKAGSVALSAHNRYSNGNTAPGKEGGDSIQHRQQGKFSRNTAHRVQTASNNGMSRQGNKITNQYFQHAEPIPNKNIQKSNNQSSINIYNQQLSHNNSERKSNNNFIQVQRIVSKNPSSQQQHSQQDQQIGRKTQSQSGVTQIVNVHNQFNISNNIIINTNPSAQNHSNVPVQGNATKPMTDPSSLSSSMPQTSLANKGHKNQQHAGRSHQGQYPQPRAAQINQPQKKKIGASRIVISQKTSGSGQNQHNKDQYQ